MFLEDRRARTDKHTDKQTDATKRIVMRASGLKRTDGRTDATNRIIYLASQSINMVYLLLQGTLFIMSNIPKEIQNMYLFGIYLLCVVKLRGFCTFQGAVGLINIDQILL